MTDPDSRPGHAVPRPLRWGRIAWAYAIAIVYVSTVLGPSGLNFVARDPLEALHAFVTMPYYDHGSDQRQDWMANLLMFAVLGFLLAAARTGARPTRAGRLVGAFLLAVVFLLAVKYAQLFFPPRTVSINYVLAQTLGASLGIAAFALLRRRVEAFLHAIAVGGRRLLLALLAIYTAALLLFMLFPFDFTLSAGDLAERIAALPAVVTGWPGEGRGTLMMVVLSLASIAVAVPFGAWLRLAWPHRGTARLFTTGVTTIAGVMALALFVLSAGPKFTTLGLRAIGLALGLGLGRWLEAGRAARLLPILRASVPVLAIGYLVALAHTKGVATTTFLPFDALVAKLNVPGMTPLWHHYIVSKSQAAQSVLVHLVLFAPVGAMVWLVAGAGRGAAWFAGLTAFALGVAVEVARGLQPELTPDFTNALFAVFAAVATLRLAPMLWAMLLDLERAPAFDDRRAAAAEAAARRGAAETAARRGGDTIAGAARDEPSPRSGAARETMPLHDDRPASHDAVDEAPATVEASAAPAPETAVARPDRRPSVSHWILAALAAAIAVALIVAYPLSRPALAAAAFATALALWLRPAAWPILVPALLCSVDLMPWSGWVYAGESDVLFASALAAMAVRRPPALRDLRLPRIVALAIGAVVATTAIGLAIGLASESAVFAHTANPYLHPRNAWRVSKGLLMALALLPFLRTDWRRDPRTPARLAAGFTLALALTAALAIVERLMFVDPLDVVTEYRVVGPFTAMHLGGSQIAVFLVLALPFAIAHLLRSRGAAAAAIATAVALGFFALAATYTRAAYASILLGLVALAAATAIARRAARGDATVAAAGRRLTSGAVAALFALLIGGALLGLAGAGHMAERLKTSGGDLALRLANWRDGLAMRDPGLMTTLFGMGAGTFPRINAARGAPAVAPTDYWLSIQDARPALSIRSGATLYFGQKIPLRVDRDHRMSLRLRAPDGPVGLQVSLCEKLVLYSTNCSSPAVPIQAGPGWERVEVALGLHPLAGAGPAWLPARPFELTLWLDRPGRRLDVAEIVLSDGGARSLLRNGDFRDGMRHWAITDDYHWAWRIESEYATALFDGGGARLAALLLLFCVALVGAVRLTLAGHALGPALVAAALTTMSSGIFDQPLQTPRLAALLYLALFAAMAGFAAAARPRSEIVGAPRPVDDGRRYRRRRRSSRSSG
ncbi:MAG: VanZ family protein [Alphaproteobacteria bacterium]|nr:VanZ family protein [Alphaproteobacteria bacterium]